MDVDITIHMLLQKQLDLQIQAKELANMAAQQTGTWYAIAAPIATQGRAIDGLLGQKAKTTIGEAVKKFAKKTGSKDFADVMSGMAKGGKIFGITGMREAVQENVQEFGNVYKINKDVNELAGQKILRTLSLWLTWYTPYCHS